MSRLLSIETATAVTAAAVFGDAVAAELVADDRRRHTEALAEAVATLMEGANWALGELDAIVVDVGPGLFTGLRVGVAFAKTLCVATGVGIYDVTSTDALAEAARAGGARGRVVSVVDARRTEVFAAAYDCTDDEATPVEGVALWSPAALAAHVASTHHGATVLGDGAVRHRDVLGPTAAELREDLVVPSALAAARLAARRRAAGEAPKGHADVSVWYLREADAVANFTVREARP